MNPNARRIQPEKITQKSAFYATPMVSKDGSRVLFATGSYYDYALNFGRGAAFSAMDEYHWIPITGGSSTFVAEVKGRRYPHFSSVDDRIYLTDNEGNLVSIRWDGTDENLDEIELFRLEMGIPRDKTFVMPAGDTRETLIEMYPKVFEMVAEKGYNMTGRDHIIAYNTERGV